MRMEERHGHVVPLPSGLLARCGGPALCSTCRKELEELAADGKPIPEGYRELLKKKERSSND